MATVEDELKQLTAAREKLDKDIAAANKTLQETQAKLSEANTQRASLQTKIAAAQKTAAEIGEQKAAGKAQREKIGKEIADTQATFDDLQAKLNRELPAERRGAIANAKTKIDGDIEDARQELAAKQKEAATAESAATESKKKAAAAAAEHQQAGDALRQWPKKIEAARGQMTKLVSDAKGALEAGRVNESYLRLLELKDVLAELPNLSSEASQNEAAKNFIDKGKAAEAATSDAAKAAAEFEKQKAAQAKADAELKKREQSRAADLKAALSKLPVAAAEGQPPAPPAESSAAPAGG